MKRPSLTRHRLVMAVAVGFAAVLPVVSCRPASRPATPAAVPPPRAATGPLTGAEFEALLDKSVAELSVKNRGHVTRWGVDRFSYWELNQVGAELRLIDPIRGEAVSPAQMVGSWLADDSTWLWAWDNPSIDDRIKRDAEQVRRFGEANNLPLLTQGQSTIPEAEAWRLAALAAHLCKAQGVYRGSLGSTAIFVSFGAVHRTPARHASEDD